MATWTGYETTPAVLTQTENWKSRCLQGHGSIFSDQELWTAENVHDLKVLFVDNPILGNQKFYDKLTLQLSEARPEVIKLAAESLWLLLLFVGDGYFKAETKISRIREIWELSGDEFAESHVLDHGALAGVANPGTAFLTMIFAEYGFLIELILALKQMPEDKRTILLHDEPWELCEWVTGRNGGRTRAFRHMFLYFCYPSSFERICSKNHKKQIYEAFVSKVQSDNDPYKANPTPCNLDKSILSIRKTLEEEFGTIEIDFYSDTIKPQWEKTKGAKKQIKETQPEVVQMPTIVSSGSLNTIYYGPPGTGKTYVTARRAVEICDGQAPTENGELRERYVQLIKQKRVEFVTFHQTYGYEEFVEGLRPEIGENEDGEPAAGFRLQPVDGVLKRIANRARKLPSTSGETFEPAGRKVFKVSLGRSNSPEDDYLREECLEQGHILLRYGGDVDWSGAEFDTYDAIASRWRQELSEEDAHGNNPNILFPFQLRSAMTEGDLILASRGNRRLQAVGVVNGPYQFKRRESDEYHHTRPVRWIWKDETGDGIPVSDVLDRNFSQQSIYGLTPKAVQWEALLPYLQVKTDAGPPPPHVMIIDEINRANISKVMGELITLLEEDKRLGAPNEIAVTLPHSGESFTLPSNLHIIGTMNTADRSIALLDTALRRRFQFVEMPPEPGILEKIDGVDVSSVLQSINTRLEWFLGTDQLIGHAWLMSATTITELDALISNKIIPLLREYFHEDLDRVRAVLGSGEKFLRREKIPAPPGIDDYGEERWRFVDRYVDEGSYGPEAYAEAIAGAEPVNTV
jgi:hypothetical protein